MLEELFAAHQGRLIDKWEHYLPIYERHFAKFVGTACRVLEIGVGHGGSLQLWKAYFGPRASIFGLDIDVRCAEYEEDQITIHIGDQRSPPGLSALDVVIDDGSHEIADQQASLDALWPKLTEGGVYLIEDCHQGWPRAPVDATSAALYPWVMVLDKLHINPRRIRSGTPSRALNEHERIAYA